MKQQILILSLLALAACETKSTSKSSLNVNVATSIANLTLNSTEYDVVSILGAPGSVSNGNYIYTDSSTGNVYTVEISLNSTFESLWTEKSMISTGGILYSYNDLQNYIDQEIIAFSNQSIDIYDSSAWGSSGNGATAAGYIQTIDAFKAAQGSNISHVTGILMNGSAIL